MRARAAPPEEDCSILRGSAASIGGFGGYPMPNLRGPQAGKEVSGDMEALDTADGGLARRQPGWWRCFEEAHWDSDPNLAPAARPQPVEGRMKSAGPAGTADRDSPGPNSQATLGPASQPDRLKIALLGTQTAWDAADRTVLVNQGISLAAQGCYRTMVVSQDSSKPHPIGRGRLFVEGGTKQNDPPNLEACWRRERV